MSDLQTREVMLCELHNKALAEARNAVIEAAKRAHAVHHSAARREDSVAWLRDTCAASEELYTAVARLNELEARS